MLTSLLRIETFTGQPVKFKDTQLRLQSQVLQLRFPFLSGGLTWHRPIAVIMHTADGQDEVLPIRDVTRRAILVLLMFSLAGMFLLTLFRRK